MPEGFPRSPNVTKGALVAYQHDQFLGATPNVIIFQYNPEELARSLSHRSDLADDAEGAELLKVGAPPLETVSLTVEVDATDQLEVRDPIATRLGILPVLSALELLLYPSREELERDMSRARLGQVGVRDLTIPFVLFVWGHSRVLPIRLTGLDVQETAFDSRLNPIQAYVALRMRVLTYRELKQSTLGFPAFWAAQIHKEATARLNVAGHAGRILDGFGL